MAPGGSALRAHLCRSGRVDVALFSLVTGFLLLWPRTTESTPLQQYHLVNLSMTWAEAQKYCRVKHADLATVKNMDDQRRLAGSLAGHRALSWIGLRASSAGRWAWSDGGGPVGLASWAEGEPSATGGENCGETTANGEWNNLDCNLRRYAACYERDGLGKKRYIIYKSLDTWKDGLDRCRRDHVDLASVETSEENARVVALGGFLWTGLFLDRWRWSSGSDTSFRFWRSDRSFGSCAVAGTSKSREWIAAPCGLRSAFVCEGGLKRKTFAVRMTVRSGVGVFDPTVAAALLEKLRSVLGSGNMTDFTLAWRDAEGGPPEETRDSTQSKNSGS